MSNTVPIPSKPEPGSLAWRHAIGSTNRPGYLYDNLRVCEICSDPLFPVGTMGTCQSCHDWLADLGVYEGPLEWMKDLVEVDL